jgi:sugar phosphate isomerase/epimerase
MALEDLFHRTSPHVGLCLDTGWMLDSGENPLEVARKFRDRLYGVHMKDFVFDRAGKPEDVVTGTGNLDLDGLASFLVEMDFDGYLSIEFEGDVDNPVPALKRCVEAIRASFAKV